MGNPNSAIIPNSIDVRLQITVVATFRLILLLHISNFLLASLTMRCLNLLSKIELLSINNADANFMDSALKGKEIAYKTVTV